MKTRVAMIFGGKTVEHEVSVISGIQACMAMDTDKYEVIPVYMTKDNEMYLGSGTGDIKSYRDIPALIRNSQRVIMVNDNGRVMLVPYPAKRWGGAKPVEIDIAFPVVHGTNVEDGALQGFLKTVGVPFVGPDVTASAVSMDKYVTKAILKEAGIPVLDARIYTLADYAEMESMLDDVEEHIGYPVIIKPVNLGSSVGISIAKNRGELVNSMDDAFRYATRVMAEHAISKLREINCAVLGNENEAIASECEEPLHTDEILSYEDKYVNNAGGKGGKTGGSKSGGSKGAGMASVARKIPAELSPEEREEVRDLAVKSFKALGCCGVSRIDFMIDEDNGELYFNEINPIPGSLAFYLWEPVGVPYTELLDRMIQLAFRRQREEEAITFTFDTNILANANLGGSKGSKR
ncbi:MAG: D-alanine--D-alanine ligase [Clostridiales bacterium]|nr:D-alanine--D-alanine ligase [Clostridiales bacterium]